MPSATLRNVGKTLFIKQKFVFYHFLTLEGGDRGAENYSVVITVMSSSVAHFPTLFVHGCSTRAMEQASSGSNERGVSHLYENCLSYFRTS